MTGDKECWVVLGGTRPGIFYEARPPKLALGKFTALLPIVVSCLSWSDGEQVGQLIMPVCAIDPDDGPALHELFKSALVCNMLTHHTAFYAFHYGKKTGIWVGHTWDDVLDNKDFKGAVYKKHNTFRDALLYMLDKPEDPYLSSAAKSAGTPSKAVAFSSPSIAQLTSLPTPHFPLQHSSISAVLKGRRSPTKEGAFTVSPPASPHVAPVLSSKCSMSPLKTSRVPSPSKLSPYTEDINDSGEPGPAGDDKELEAALEASLQIKDAAPYLLPHVQYLRRVLRDPAALGDDGGPLSLIRLGIRADAYLQGRGATHEQTLRVLQAHVYSEDIEAFSYNLGLLLGWPIHVAQQLWRLITLPSM